MGYFNPTAPMGQDYQPVVVGTDQQQGNTEQQPSAVARLRSKFGITEGWRDVVAGAYVAEILRMMHDQDQQRVYVPFDIAEGEYKGAYSASDTPDWANRAMFSTKDSWAFEQLVKGLVAISASNPGFDAPQAFFDEDWDAFVGKRVGIVLQEREYVNKYNDLASALNVMRFIPVDDVPNTPAPPIRHLRKEVL